MKSPAESNGAPGQGGSLPEGTDRWGDRALAWWFGWAAVVLGALIMLGWVMDEPLLRSWFPHQVEAKANAALCFILIGAAVVLKSVPPSEVGRGHLVLGNLFVAFGGGIALLTLGQYVLGWDVGIDSMLFEESETAPFAVYPGRMTLPASISLLLLSIAALVADPGKARPLAGWLVAPAVLVAGLAFLGHLYDLPVLTTLGAFTPIAAPAGAALLALGGGIFFAGGGGTVAWFRDSARTIGFISALVLLLLIGGAVALNARMLVRNSRLVTHTHEVMDRLNELLADLHTIEAGARGYLLSGDREFLELYEPAVTRVGVLRTELRQLTADNPRQQARLDHLDELAGRKLAVALQQVDLRDRGRAAEALALFGTGEGRRLMGELRALLGEMRAEELRLLTSRQEWSETSTAKTFVTVGLGLGAALSVLGVVFVMLRREIAARTRLAAELRKSEQSLAVTLNSIGDGVLATDTAGRVTWLNPVAEQLTGWPLAEARGLAVEGVFRIVHERTREPAPMPVRGVLATGETKTLANHTALLARDGSERSIADSAAPIRDAEHRMLGVVLVFRDVTESRIAQEQLDRFFELSLDFLCIASQDGYFKRASPAVTDILGWTVEEFLARPYLEQIHPDDRASALREVERQAAGEKVMHYECRFRHKDGSWRLLAWRSVPYDGMMYATARDVTDARRAEEQIRTLNGVLQRHSAQLETANKELESFSYSVSHDLRAPLRHVQGYVEMLAREASGSGLSEKGRRFLNTIAEAAREMGMLIDDLLSFSRMSRTEMTEAVVDPAMQVAEVRKSLETDMAGREIRWRVGELPRVRADGAMLRQVFANLLGNAVKYTRRKPQAEIVVGCAGTEEGRIILYVRDNGAGFDMKYADKLFGVFQRLHRADEFEGTGIGLATVRRIVGRHGGRIWAEAKPGEGATFYFTLPAADPVPASSATPTAP